MSKSTRTGDKQGVRFEIFVNKGFCEFEAAAVVQVLSVANELAASVQFTWRYVSDTPGILTGSNGMMLRAEPAVPNYGFSDVMVVVGGRKSAAPAWLARARAMQRQGLKVVLLSDAATVFVQNTRAPTGKVTTHWRDVMSLSETGYHPNLTLNLAESADGIITAAGQSGAVDLMIGLIAPLFDGPQVAELGNRLMVQTIRKSGAEQPRDISHNATLFDERITAAIKLMEENIAEPLSLAELTSALGVSQRHLERKFREIFDDSPARFYKRLRAKRARMILEETVLPVIDVAIATGFGSYPTLVKALKSEYGTTPTKIRARKSVDLLEF